VVAIAWLLSDAPRRLLTWAVVGGMCTAAGGAVLAVGLTPGQRSEPLNPGTVLGLDVVLHRSGPFLNVAAIVVVGFLCLGVAVALAWRWPGWAFAAIAVAFSLGAYDTFHTYLVPGSVARSRQDVLATTIARATSMLGLKPSCVGFDAGIDFTYFNDRFYLPGWDVESFDGSTGDAPCGPFAISTRPNFFAFHAGAQIVSVENDLPMILYAMPGPVLTRLEKAGWLLPATLPGPLPLAAQHAVLSTSGAPRSLPVGGRGSVTVRALNAGSGGNNAWPNLRGLRQDGFVVRVTARWFPAGAHVDAPGQDGDDPVATSVIELPRTLMPGQRVALRLPLVPRTSAGVRLPPGNYFVVIAVYQELVGSFPGGTTTIPVAITP
jgi:hypothetical protein